MKNKTIYTLLSGLIILSCTSQNQGISKKSSDYLTANTSPIVVPVDYTYSNDSTFKLLSWNAEHFVDPYDDPYIDNERENNPPENMPLRVNLFLKALKMADADIVLLQEFESAKYLKQLASDSLAEMEYRYFADIPSHDWYMNVVVMSRFPMGVIHGYGAATTPLPGYTTDEGEQETQNSINTRMWSIDIFPAEDYSFMLTGVHLKAGRGERNIAMRKGQINLLISEYNRLLKENPGKHIILAGDLNATPDSEELALLQKSEGLKVHFVDAIDTSLYSHPSHAPSRRLDYILVNENMYSRTLTDSLKIENYFSSDTMNIISDHLPLIGVFLKK
ncbi:MAG: endonuclease/exonuclease/phosphatase family protein [Bacteroidota bacterium]|nr:endonuclease/exonuclease/phosphatase family protein [Bacteroidota bacterium]